MLYFAITLLHCMPSDAAADLLMPLFSLRHFRRRHAADFFSDFHGD